MPDPPKRSRVAVLEVKLGLSSTLLCYESCLASKLFEVLNSEPEIQPRESSEGRCSNPSMLSSRSHKSLPESSRDGIITGLANSAGSSSQGRLQLEYFLRRKEMADLNVGDFFHIPPGLVHRDLNPNKDLELVVVNILVGSGPSVINVDSPSRGD